PLLTRGEVSSVKCVGLLSGREARVLPDSPRALDVHRRIRAAKVGRLSRDRAEMGDIREVTLGEEALHRDAFGRFPKRVRSVARFGAPILGASGRRGGLRGVKIERRKIKE